MIKMNVTHGYNLRQRKLPTMLNIDEDCCDSDIEHKFEDFSVENSKLSITLKDTLLSYVPIFALFIISMFTRLFQINKSTSIRILEI